MEVTTLEKDRNYEKVRLVFSREEIEHTEDKLARELNKEIELPGFRKGKVPKSVLKMRFPKYFEENIVDELIDEWIRKQDRELILDPVKLSEENGEESIVVELELHWEPEVELADVEELVVEIPSKSSVVEEVVRRNLEALRKERATLEPKSESAESDDVVLLKYKIVDEQSGEVVKDEETTEVEVGALKWLEKELLGKKEGDLIEASVSEGEKEARYRLQGVVERVYRKILPELDDEFASSVDEKFKTLEDLKAEIRKRGEKEYEDFRVDTLPTLALAKLIESSNIVVSDRSLDALVDKSIKRLKEEGEYEKLLEEAGSEEAFREDLREKVIESLKDRFVPLAYGKKHGISVTTEEIEEYVEKMAPLWRLTPQQARAAVFSDKELFWKVVEHLYEHKIGDHLAGKVKIEETEFGEEDSETEEKGESVSNEEANG